MLNATLRDYARFGYFFMHGGKIGNESILPEGWVAEASPPTCRPGGVISGMAMSGGSTPTARTVRSAFSGR